MCLYNFPRIISFLIFTLLLFLFCFNKCSLAGRSIKMVFADKWRTPTVAKCMRFSKSFGSAKLLHSNFGCWSTAQCHCWYTIADTPLLIHRCWYTQSLSFPFHLPYSPIYHLFLPTISPYSLHYLLFHFSHIFLSPSLPFFTSPICYWSLSYCLTKSSFTRVVWCGIH